MSGEDNGWEGSSIVTEVDWGLVLHEGGARLKGFQFFSTKVFCVNNHFSQSHFQTKFKFLYRVICMFV